MTTPVVGLSPSAHFRTLSPILFRSPDHIEAAPNPANLSGNSSKTPLKSGTELKNLRNIIEARNDSHQSPRNPQGKFHIFEDAILRSQDFDASTSAAAIGRHDADVRYGQRTSDGDFGDGRRGWRRFDHGESEGASSQFSKCPRVR